MTRRREGKALERSFVQEEEGAERTVWCGPREPHEKSKGKGRRDGELLSSEIFPHGVLEGGPWESSVGEGKEGVCQRPDTWMSPGWGLPQGPDIPPPTSPEPHTSLASCLL